MLHCWKERQQQTRAIISVHLAWAWPANEPCGTSICTLPPILDGIFGPHYCACLKSVTPLEDLAIRWLRWAGFELYTQKATGGQFGFSVAGRRIQGHVDGVINGAPETLGMKFPHSGA